MSKWTEVRDIMASCPHISEECLTAFDIAERVDKAEANVYEQYCECCVTVGICRDRAEICAEASYWIDGYNQALADVRGDTE